MKVMNDFCPCGKLIVYESCCEIIHFDISQALTAEELMRSRYTAFTKGMGDYLLLSHHSSARPLERIGEIVEWANSVIWQSLEVLNTTNGQSKDTVGTVRFKASFTLNGRADFILENSKFTKENGCWMYLGFA